MSKPSQTNEEQLHRASAGLEYIGKKHGNFESEQPETSKSDSVESISKLTGIDKEETHSKNTVFSSLATKFKRLLPSSPVPNSVQEDDTDITAVLSLSEADSFGCHLKAYGCIYESNYLWEETSDRSLTITCNSCRKHYHISCAGLKEDREDYVCFCKDELTKNTDQEEKSLKTKLVSYGDLHVKIIDVNSLMPRKQLTHRLVSFILNHLVSKQEIFYLFPMWLECPSKNISGFRCSPTLEDFGTAMWTNCSYFLFPVLTIHLNGHYNLSFWMKSQQEDESKWDCAILDSGNQSNHQKCADFVRKRIINRLVSHEEGIDCFQLLHVVVPTQPNDYDCGICLIKFIAQILQDMKNEKTINDCFDKLKTLDFSQERLNETRNILKLAMIFYQKTAERKDIEKEIEVNFTQTFLLDALCHTSEDGGERLRVYVLDFPNYSS